MRYMVVTSRVEVVGRIWMPGVTAAMSYTLSGYDVENIRDDDGNITRDGVQRWLDTHAGDFASIEDFHADIADGDEDIVIPWESEDAEMTYFACTEGED